jgi:hypothetical protein
VTIKGVGNLVISAANAFEALEPWLMSIATHFAGNLVAYQLALRNCLGICIALELDLAGWVCNGLPVQTSVTRVDSEFFFGLDEAGAIMPGVCGAIGVVCVPHRIQRAFAGCKAQFKGIRSVFRGVASTSEIMDKQAVRLVLNFATPMTVSSRWSQIAVGSSALLQRDLRIAEALAEHVGALWGRGVLTTARLDEILNTMERVLPTAIVVFTPFLDASTALESIDNRAFATRTRSVLPPNGRRGADRAHSTAHVPPASPRNVGYSGLTLRLGGGC